MTIVVTTASEYGITVVGDKAQTSGVGDHREVRDDARKVHYSVAANVCLAFWGNARMPSGEPLDQWARRFVDALAAADSLSDVGRRLAAEMNSALRLLYQENDGWEALRRGVHVAGYAHGLPCIYHVHTGNPSLWHGPPQLFCDFPNEHFRSVSKYRRHLAAHRCAQLRNGKYVLFGNTFDFLQEGRLKHARVAGFTPVPANLRLQLAIDALALQLAAKRDALESATLSVSENVDCIAFTASGLVANAIDAAVVDAVKKSVPDAFTSICESMRVSPDHTRSQGTHSSSISYGPLDWAKTDKYRRR
jgi:hypothetical protein